ncbi:MAG: HxsD-like protein [Byssovorax sp.]|jgi:hypothetical protein
MTEVTFHHELYDGFAVDEAAKIYADYGTMDLERKPGGFVVRVTINADTAAQGIDEATLVAELANYALGKTIEKRTSAAEVAS